MSVTSIVRDWILDTDSCLGKEPRAALLRLGGH